MAVVGCRRRWRTLGRRWRWWWPWRSRGRWERRSVARIGNVISGSACGLWDKPAAAGKTSPTARPATLNIIALSPPSPGALAAAAPPPMSMVQLALKRPYTFIVMAMLIVLATPFALRNMATDIFPEIDIPVISIIWNYNGLPAQEMGQRIAGAERAQPDDDGERHRAHRVDLARRHHGHQGLLPADRQHPDRDRAGRRDRADAGAPAAARHHAAARHQVLGVEHPGDPARPVEPDAARADGVRRRGQHAAAAADHDPRRRDPVPVRRQEPRDLGRPRHAGAAGARPGAGRRRQRGQPAEPDPAVGHGQVRRHRIQRCA